tara:strand:- start:54 stop:620 length:567 start_codon:yes stop_codon:yes gene_type:complete
MWKNLISFDVGIKNMCFCLVKYTKSEYEIIKWKTFEAKGKTISDVIENLIKYLRAEDISNINNVLIEQQMNNNIKMKVLSHVLQCYFICEQKIPIDSILFLSPKSRFETSEKTYKDIIESVSLGAINKRLAFKKLSIEVCGKILSDANNISMYDYFHSHPKKDDLADCFLQFFSWYLKQKDNILILHK